MECKWDLTLPNGTVLNNINSITDLENAIKTYYPDYISKAGLKFSFEDITQKIDADAKLIREASKINKPANVSGVLDFINSVDGLTQGFDTVAFEKSFKETLLNTLTDNGRITSDLIQNDVDKGWADKQAEIQKSRELGKGLHLIIEKLIWELKTRSVWGDNALENLFDKVISSTEDNIAKTNDKIRDGILEAPKDGVSPSLQGFSATDLKKVMDQFTKTIYNPIFASSEKVWVRTEQPLQEKLSEEFSNMPGDMIKVDTVKGKIDVLFVYEDKQTKRTKAVILDIKTSGTYSDEWDADRINTVDVQLNFYKRLLARKGIYENDITTKSLVIKLDAKDPNAVKIEGSLDAKPRYLKDEKYRIIQKILPLKEKILPEDEKFIKDIGNDFNLFWDENPTTGELDVILNAQIKKRIQVVPVGNEIHYKTSFNDKDHKLVTEVFKTKEAAEEHVKSILLDRKNDLTWITNISNKIENAINSGSFQGIFNSTDEKNSFWQRNLQKYVDVSGWRIEISSTYARLGVLVFVNDNTKEIDIVKLSKDIKANVKISGNSNVLGKFISDTALKQQTRDDFMPSTVGNIELLKALTIANRLNMEGYTLGEIKVLDSLNNIGTCSIINSKLLSNFKTLCFKNPSIPNNNLKFRDKFLQALEIITYAKKSLGAVNTSNLLNEKVNKTLEPAFLKTLDKAKQIEILSEISEILKLEHDDYSKDAQNAFYDSFPGFVYREVLSRISDLSNVKIDWANSDYITQYGLTADSHILNGLRINSLDSIKILSPIYNLKTHTDAQIRARYTPLKSADNRITKEYIDYATKKGGYGLVANAVVNVETVIYTKFYDKSETGDLVLIDPDDSSKNSELDEVDKKYLRYWLKDLNEHRILASGNKLTVEKLKSTGLYWKVPLTKSGLSSRLIHNKLQDIPKGASLDYKTQLQDYNQETDISMEGYDPSKIEAFTMQNSIGLSDSEFGRSKLLENVNPYMNYETNLEAVKDLYVQSYIVEQEWNAQMTILNAVMINLKLANYLYGESTDELIKFLNDYINSSIKGRSILDKEIKGPAKVLGVAKSFVTAAALGFNWKSGFKEFVMSNYTLYKNAVVNSRFDKDRLTFSEVNFATKFIWGDLFQQGDANKITMAQGLNFLYGMVDNTIYETSEKQNFNVTKMFKWSNRMLAPNKFPDFTGRMTLLVGYLHKVGALDAHSIENDYDVVYDWSKDKRFELYANDKSGLSISENQKQEWANQRGNYVSRMVQLKNKGWKITDKETGTLRNLELTDDLPIAFTSEEIGAFKQESNTMFGYMDTDEKSLIYKLSQGLLFGHFSTFLTAKKNQLILHTDKNGQGKWKQMTEADTGLPMYQRIIQDEDGNIIDYEPTTEVTDMPLYGWNGTITEGMLWSLMDLFNFTKMDTLKEAWKDPYKKKNALIALEDLFAFLLLLIIGNVLFGSKKNLEGGEKIAANLLSNGAKDINGFQALAGVLQFKVPTFDFITNTWSDAKKLLLGDIDLGYMVGNRFSVVRDFLPKPEPKDE